MEVVVAAVVDRLYVGVMLSGAKVMLSDGPDAAFSYQRRFFNLVNRCVGISEGLSCVLRALEFGGVQRVDADVSPACTEPFSLSLSDVCQLKSFILTVGCALWIAVSNTLEYA